jgi:hypothetical protein
MKAKQAEMEEIERDPGMVRELLKHAGFNKEIPDNNVNEEERREVLRRQIRRM